MTMRLRSGSQPCPGTLSTLQASTPALSKTPATILKLPLELLLSIFEAQHSLRDVARLCSTCTELRSLWRSHYHLITQAILPHEILCYDDARALAEAQACIKPSSIQENVDRAKSRLSALESGLEAQYTDMRNEIPDEFVVPSIPDLAAAASEETSDAIFETKNVIERYQQLIDLVGDAGQKDPYRLHLRYLRRLYRNAKETILVAKMFTFYLLPGARHPSTFIESELPKDPYYFHPKNVALPHEMERAVQCIYFTRLNVLGHFNETISRESRSSLQAMSFVKVDAMSTFLSPFLVGLGP